jgi:hypothetical protein
VLKYHPKNLSKINNYQRLLPSLAALVLCSCGAASNDDYARMAQAGDAYTVAMDTLLVSTQALRIDSTSEKMLANDILSNYNGANYLEDSKRDDDLIEVIDELRVQNKFLRRYFNLLYELATSDAPTLASQAASGIGSSLESVNTKIAINPIVLKSGQLPAALGSVTKVAVSVKIREALRDELDKRQVTIKNALVIQSKLLEILAIDAKASLADIKVNRRNRQVIHPLTDQKQITFTDDADAWVKKRISIEQMRVNPQELEEASRASEELNQAFQDLISDKLTIARIKNLLADIDSLLKIAESLKS